MSRFYTVVLLSLSLVIMNGCSSNKLKNTKLLADAAKKQAETSVITPQQAFEEAAASIKNAKDQELDFFAPIHSEEANLSYAEAQKLLSSKSSSTKILEECFKVKQLVLAGIKHKSQVKITLARSVEHLNIVKEIGAEQFFRDEYKDRKGDVKELIIMIEKGDTKDAVKEEKEVLEKLSELEVKTIFAKYISPAEEMLKKAKTEKADELAEVTYKKAEEEIKNADAYVKANYKNHSAVEKVGASALRAANHAYYVAKEVVELDGMKPKLAEQRVLYIESLFTKITQSMNIDSGIGKSLYEQSKYISSKTADSNQQEKNELMKQIDKLKSENVLLKQDLESSNKLLGELNNQSSHIGDSDLSGSDVVEIVPEEVAATGDATESAHEASELPVIDISEEKEPVAEATEKLDTSSTVESSDEVKQKEEPDTTEKTAAPAAVKAEVPEVKINETEVSVDEKSEPVPEAKTEVKEKVESNNEAPEVVVIEKAPEETADKK